MKKMKKRKGGGRKQEMSGKDEETGQELRVGRVLSFSPVVEIGTPPPPHPQTGEGVGESKFRRGDIHCGRARENRDRR
jgi:hypothetical protein